MDFKVFFIELSAARLLHFRTIICFTTIHNQLINSDILNAIGSYD